MYFAPQQLQCASRARFRLSRTGSRFQRRLDDSNPHCLVAGAITGRPPWMAEVPVMQERFPADRQGRSLASCHRGICASLHIRWRKCRSCRSDFRPTARAALWHPAIAAFVHPCTSDGGSAGHAGAISGRQVSTRIAVCPDRILRANHRYVRVAPYAYLRPACKRHSPPKACLQIAS